ncbi:MAG TPA: PRTRC system protein E [Longimicrobiaceae bacterium]|jgi:PRTRC genetic system protein E|nr:PRTRC system protein E [Longimicrobiaceae bacterium]
MSDPHPPDPGLMQAIAPVASRRPVHMILSGAANGRLHLVVQPVQLEGESSPELSRGFSVEATPAELDRDLPALFASRWVPAHVGLQKAIDQVASAAGKARDDTLRGAKDKPGKAKGKPGAADQGQTELATAEDPSAPAPEPAEAPDAAAAPGVAPDAAAEKPAVAARAARSGAKKPDAPAPDVRVVHTTVTPPVDAVSALFN